MQLSPEQLQIRDHATGNAVVVAGAGTGKTETLTQRVLKLLLDGAELHELLALTFTDKAAGEMRQRIYQGLLRRLHESQNSQERARLQKLRAEFGEANRIGTFDSFNSRLLALYPERQLLAPGFEPMSDFDRREIRALCDREFWNWAETTDDPRREDLFALFDRFGNRGELLDALDLLARENRADLEKLGAPNDWESWEAELLVLVEEARNRALRRSARLVGRLWKHYLVALAPDLPDELRAVLSDETLADGSQKSEIITAAGEWTAKFRKNCPPEWVDRLPASLLARVRKQSKAAATDLEELELAEERLALDWQSHLTVQRLARLALWWREKRRELCRRRRLADFDDLREAVARLLEDEEVCVRLRATFGHILVDEFQDTDWNQWQLIDKIRRPDNVMLIGDQKQSIYAFRQADITVFDEVRRLLLGDKNAYPLAISRRSTAPIVAWCNAVFADVLPPPDDREPYEAPFQALEAARDAAWGVWRVRGPQDDMADDEEAPRRRLARGVARFLKGLWDGTDERPEFADIRRDLAAGRSGTVALLFRTHSAKGVFEAALQEAGVPFSSVKGRGFWSSSGAFFTTHLLRFCLDTSDDLALVGLLRSPLGALDDASLLELKLAALIGEKSCLWDVLEDANLSDESAQRALEIARERFGKWRAAAGVCPVSEVLECVLDESEMAFYDAQLPDATQRSENWRKLLDIVRERERRGQGGVRALAEFFGHQIEHGSDEADATLPEAGAIQLMTVYAAKGLGFPMTILAQMDDLQPPNAPAFLRGTFPTRFDRRWAFKTGDETEDDEKKKTRRNRFCGRF